MEQLTEELEESKSTTLYEDYKFLTATDLQKLDASHLIGTPALKAYMHGYFMDLKSYQKLAQAANPFAYEQYRKQQIQKKLADKMEKRISLKKKAKVNVDYVQQLESQGQLDGRFKEMFENDEFKIDKNAPEYKIHKPTAKQ